MQLTPVLTTIAALGAVLGLIWIAARLLKISGLAPMTAQPGRLAIEAILSLDSKRRLLLVRCDHQSLLILTNPSNDTIVGWLPGNRNDVS